MIYKNCVNKSYEITFVSPLGIPLQYIMNNMTFCKFCLLRLVKYSINSFLLLKISTYSVVVESTVFY